MKYFRAYFRWFLVTFGIGVGGLFLCGFIAIMLAYFLGPESQSLKVCFFLLIIPALISFLLGVGLGDNAFREACAKIDRRNDSSQSSILERNESQEITEANKAE